MVYFITANSYNFKTDKITSLHYKKDDSTIIMLLESFVMDNWCCGFDVETNGLDPYYNDMLLSSIGSYVDQFVFDETSLPVDYSSNVIKNYEDYRKSIKEPLLFIGHNIGFDYKMLKTKNNYGIKTELYDTMIAAQRLTANVGIENGFPIPGYYRLDNVMNRYLGYIPKEMQKDIRNQFIGRNPKDFVFTEEQILYQIGDVKYMIDLMEALEEQVEKYNLAFLLGCIEFPLIKILANLELEGIYINEDKWRKNVVLALEEKWRLELEMDKAILVYRDEYSLALDEDSQTYLNQSSFNKPRLQPRINIVPDIFGGSSTYKKNLKSKPVQFNETVNSHKIDYNSTNQLLFLLAKCNVKIPTKTGEYIDDFEFDKKGKLKKRPTEDNYTLKAEFLELLINEHEDHPMIDFLKLLILYRKTLSTINTFGESFLSNKNPVTGKFHTAYRQCGAVNGRFQSGGGGNDSDKFNSQNVPAKKEFRECFHAGEDYSIATIDLSGAEVTIMCDKANDKKLYTWAIVLDDAHSPIITAGWRKIFKHRATQANKVAILAKTEATIQEAKELAEKALNYTVSKTENKNVRSKGKNSTFGTVYGAGPKTIAKAFNISVLEGAIYIDSLKSEIPDTFKYVESNVNLALRKGYLILDDRTNARVWFPSVFYARKSERELEFHEKRDIDGQARNIPISGTQANMIKESIVEIQKTIDTHNIDSSLLLQVHDELVYKVPKNLDGISTEWEINNNGITFLFDKPITHKKYEKLSEHYYSHYKTFKVNDENFITDCVVSMSEFIRLTMMQVATRYLKNVTMNAELTVKDTWTK